MSKDMKEQIRETLDERLPEMKKAKDRQTYHLMADIGWISDPNGLSYHDGWYHVFHQYTPAEDRGLSKSWGHWRTKDWKHFEDLGTTMCPDSWMDKDGCYSGSGLSLDDGLHLFYTGNILEEGDHDYILSGRGHYVNHIASKDGLTFGEKECLLKNEDYPANMSCHVRDPKVILKDGRLQMVLGARTRDDRGCALLYTAAPDQLHDWKFEQVIDSNDQYGYMWECPDLLDFEDKEYLLCCPQGVKRDCENFQNIYQNGLFAIETEADGLKKATDFQTLDHGFDFYAPQTLEAPDGRRILLGWMAMPDAEYDYPEKEQGWIHTLTLPRELQLKGGRITQFPIREVLELAGPDQEIELKADVELPLAGRAFRLHLDTEGEPFELDLRHDAKLKYENGLFTLSLKESGAGRTERNVRIADLKEVDIFSDASSLEIFLNHGEAALSTRIYDAGKPLKLKSHTGLKGRLASMNPLDFDYTAAL